MEEQIIKIGEYEVILRSWEEDNRLHVIVLDALGEEIEAMEIHDINDNEEDDNEINLN